MKNVILAACLFVAMYPTCSFSEYMVRFETSALLFNYPSRYIVKEFGSGGNKFSAIQTDSGMNALVVIQFSDIDYDQYFKKLCDKTIELADGQNVISSNCSVGHGITYTTFENVVDGRLRYTCMLLVETEFFWGIITCVAEDKVKEDALYLARVVRDSLIIKQANGAVRSVSSASMAENSDGLDFVRTFATIKQSEVTNLAHDLDLPLHPGIDLFFKAAIDDDWSAISNAFDRLTDSAETHWERPIIRNPLWIPIHETYGAHEEWAEWKYDTALLRMLYDPILASMPDGSIYFGGTDFGRFLVTAVRDARDSPDIIVLTQNALTDASYAEYLRHAFGDRVWMFSVDDKRRALQRYVDEVKSGKREPDHIEFSSGRVNLRGAEAVMEINGLIAEMIFEHNKEKHEFYVEESYVIDWMYPYLEPHGLIFRLHEEEQDGLSKETVTKDQSFWNDYVDKLMAHPTFEGNLEARKAFSKLRAANAGLYAYLGRFELAEHGFRQALQLFPKSPEVYFRLGDMYEKQGHTEKAIEAFEELIHLEPKNERAQERLTRLRKGKRSRKGVRKEGSPPDS